MGIWIFRVFVVLGCPAVVYSQASAPSKAVWVGAALGLIIVASEFLVAAVAAARRRGAEVKVLDASAIIDGRVVDVCETRFLSGSLVVPRFVQAELHRLAGSSDAMQRARGRRGLDILARLQENPEAPVRIVEKMCPTPPTLTPRSCAWPRAWGPRW